MNFRSRYSCCLLHWCFGRCLQTVYPNFANDIPLKSYENFATFICRGFSEIPNGLGAVFSIQNSYFELLFYSGLQTVYPNFANDIPLKSYENFATFLCRTFFEIPNGLGAVFNIQNPYFELPFCSGLQTVYPNLTNDILLKR